MSIDINELQAALAQIQANKAAAVAEPDPVTPLEYAQRGARSFSLDAVTSVINHLIDALTTIEQRLAALEGAASAVEAPTALPVTDSPSKAGTGSGRQSAAAASGSTPSPN